MIPIRILLVGDTHGVSKSMLRAINEAGKRKIQHVVVLGDFGLWDHWAEGFDFLEDTQRAAEANNLSVYAIGGNHENWDRWNWYVENNPTHKGFAMVRRRVLLAPKAHRWTWDNKQFVGAGGAVSIDKADRLRREQGGEKMSEWGFMQHYGRGTGPKTQYWPNEQLTREDVNTIKSWNVKADYLFTHDCSNYTPFYGRLKPDMDSEIHRRLIDDVLRATTPKMHFHGHMHTKYDWINAFPYGYSAFMDGEWTGPETQTYGLECNDDYDAWGILDTETDTFAFRGEGMNFRSLGDGVLKASLSKSN